MARFKLGCEVEEKRKVGEGICTVALYFLQFGRGNIEDCGNLICGWKNPRDSAEVTFGNIAMGKVGGSPLAKCWKAKMLRETIIKQRSPVMLRRRQPEHNRCGFCQRKL